MTHVSRQPIIANTPTNGPNQFFRVLTDDGMNIEIALFGQLCDLAGGSKISVSDVKDTDSLTWELLQKYPAMAGATFVIAVDKQVVSENTPLFDHSQVALLPPFSGG